MQDIKLKKLIHEVMVGNVKQAEDILNEYPYLSDCYIDDDQNTIGHFAATSSNDIDMLEMLILKNVNFSSKNSGGNSAWVLIRKNTIVELKKRLLRKKINYTDGRIENINQLND